jgi:hypothetical protein
MPSARHNTSAALQLDCAIPPSGQNNVDSGVERYLYEACSPHDQIFIPPNCSEPGETPTPDEGCEVLLQLPDQCQQRAPSQDRHFSS